MKWPRPTNFTGVVIRRSIAAAIALGALFTAIPAMAQVEKTVTSGIWSAFAGTHGDTPSCGVGAQLPDRSFAVSVQRDRPGVVRITVGTPGWDGEQVPPHTDISFEPSGALYGLTSAGSVGHFDYFDLDSARVRTWVHDFTAGSKMILSFPDEATWSFDLTGTSPTISAMLKCVTDNNMAGLPAPFALTAQPCIRKLVWIYTDRGVLAHRPVFGSKSARGNDLAVFCPCVSIGIYCNNLFMSATTPCAYEVYYGCPRLRGSWRGRHDGRCRSRWS